MKTKKKEKIIDIDYLSNLAFTCASVMVFIEDNYDDLDDTDLYLIAKTIEMYARNSTLELNDEKVIEKLDKIFDYYTRKDA